MVKIRILSQLQDEKLGQTTLSGKILTCLDDNVGFFMAQFLLTKDQSHDLASVFQDHNHIYYCIKGKVTVKVDSQQFTLNDNTLLALSPSTKASLTALDSSRMVIVSVPALPNQHPPPYFLSLKQVLGTDRDVNFGLGQSRRFLKQSDGFNISVHNTVPSLKMKANMEYKNHFEANLLFKGHIQYWWNNETETVIFDEKDSATGDGVMCLLDKHDPHQNYVTQEDSHIICVFYPALKGDEKHDFSGTGGSSY